MRNESDKTLWWIGVGASVAVAGAAVALAAERDGRTDSGNRKRRPRLRTVDKVDLNSYMGTWYEIARNPNPFEGDCAGNTMAHYSMRDDGRVDVINSCRMTNGKRQTVRGIAKVADPVTNAKLKVQFRWPFAGDYWILVLNSFYEYAVVGEPERKYLWILSRTPTMDRGTFRGLAERIEELGYDSSKLLITRQSERTPQQAKSQRHERDLQETGARQPRSASPN